MAQSIPMPRNGEAPFVRLELRHGSARPTWHDVGGEEFLIGSVPGCDLRVPGANLPPIIAQVVRRPDGVRLRKLAPAQAVFLNGQPVANQATLAHNDCIRIGAVDLLVHLALPEAAPTPAPRPTNSTPVPGVAFVPLPPPVYTPPPPYLSPAPEPANVWQHYQAEVTQFRQQVAQFEHQRRQWEVRQQELEQKHRQLEEHERELEQDRVIWYQRREQVERECHELNNRNAEQEMRLRQVEQSLQQQQAALDLERHSLAHQQQQLRHDAQQVQELRLTLQNRERDLDQQFRDLTARVQSIEPRLAELDAREKALLPREAEMARLTETLAKDKLWHDTRFGELQKKLEAQEADLRVRESRLAAEQQAVQQMQAQYQTDLMRLDRQNAALEEREKAVGAREEELTRRSEQMQLDAREMEEQARLLDAAQVRIKTEVERLAAQKAEQEARAAELAERTATLEGQQAMLATLRTRMERLREELRLQAQQIATERAKQDEISQQVKERLEAADRLRGELDQENRNRDEERSVFRERSAALQSAVVHLRQMQERLEADDQRIMERSRQLDAQAAEQAEQAGLLRARAQQFLELQQRIEADRASIREREAALAQAEEARKALQEQLLRRSEELSARAKAIEEQSESLSGRESELMHQRSQFEAERARAGEQLDALRQDIEARSAEIQRLSAALTQREDTLRRQIDRLKEAGQTIAADRKTLFETKARWEAEQLEAAERLAQARAEIESFRDEVVQQAGELGSLMPELELRSQGAIDRLSQSREQLRGHLQELHSYSRQSQEDLQELRAQVQAEADRLRQQELALHRARSEHRLAVTAFRQQLIDWQGRVAELKQLFSQHEGRLELKQQAVEAAAREVDHKSGELAKQAETLQQQQREVAERKTEVERHLGEMRDWYRQKLRELAGSPPRPFAGAVLEMPAANGVNDPAPPRPASSGRDILSLTGDVDPADRKLGELLLQLGLVDEEVLVPLWNEARRQRRSLRQVLLNSGTITLYQMALIEAGSIDRLVLGPYRVIDRVQSGSRESLYRVFDPQRGGPALLRHLAEAEMADAVRPDEYRQRFAAMAELSHPNLAATYQVLEIAGRPAALQEWVTGLTSADWPAFAAAPGVWYRLLGQAGLGMQAAHHVGIAHGNFNASSAVLTAGGVLKLVGFGEPAWINGGVEPADGIMADLQALGRLACAWSMLSPRTKRSKPRPLPEALQNVIRRLGAPAFAGVDGNDQTILLPPFDEAERYPAVTAMLEDLDQAGADLPPNAEAWDRLIKHAGENAIEGAALRRTA